MMIFFFGEVNKYLFLLLKRCNWHTCLKLTTKSSGKLNCRFFKYWKHYDFLRDPDWESVSDLRTRGWPNSTEFGEDINLDELLLDPVLFVFVLSSFCFFQGGSYFGVSEYKKTPIWELTFEYQYNKCRKHTAYVQWYRMFAPRTNFNILYGFGR